MCFGCSKEPSHQDGSFEYPQHMFWLRNKKNNFQNALLSGGLQARSGSKLQGKVIHRLCYLLLKHYHEIYFNIYDAPLYEAVGYIDLILVLVYVQLLKMHILYLM